MTSFPLLLDTCPSVGIYSVTTLEDSCFFFRRSSFSVSLGISEVVTSTAADEMPGYANTIQKFDIKRL